MTAFKELAQESTTLLLPGDTNNPAAMVAQVITDLSLVGQVSDWSRFDSLSLLSESVLNTYITRV